MKSIILRPDLSKPVGLGDAVSSVAQPIAKLIDFLSKPLPAALQTKLAECKSCKERAEIMNKFMENINPLRDETS